MKKTTTLLMLILLFVSPSFAQVIIDEDFQNITFPPSGWISLDEDGLISSNNYTGNWQRLVLPSRSQPQFSRLWFRIYYSRNI